MTKHPIGEQLANSLPLFVKGEPYTIDEIDQHPDRERIWRTIQEICGYYEQEADSTCEDCHKNGKEEGEAVGYERGWVDGKDEGENLYDDGYNFGFDTGMTVGYDKGYKEGFNDGRNT